MIAAEMKQHRVIVASGYLIVRLGLRQLLESTPGMLVVGEADDGAAVLRLVERSAPDVLLLNPRLRGISGVEVWRGWTTQQSGSAELGGMLALLGIEPQELPLPSEASSVSP